MKKILFVLLANIFVISSFAPICNLAYADEWNPSTPWWDPAAPAKDKPTEKAQDVGIKVTDNPCLFWMWQWCFDYEKAVGIDDEQHPNMSATTIVQDIIFAATYMVWTVLTLVIIWCGLGYILASKDGKDATTYRKWLVSAAIWAILVWWAYGIVRLIQYIANW